MSLGYSNSEANSCVRDNGSMSVVWLNEMTASLLSFFFFFSKMGETVVSSINLNKQLFKHISLRIVFILAQVNMY